MNLENLLQTGCCLSSVLLSAKVELKPIRYLSRQINQVEKDGSVRANREEEIMFRVYSGYESVCVWNGDENRDSREIETLTICKYENKNIAYRYF